MENKTFQQFLDEMFDKPWKMELDKESSMEARKNAKEYGSGERMHHIYNLEGDNGKLITYHKDGYTEIHHQSKRGLSGIISNIESGKEGANPRFYSTAIHHAKEHLDKGRGVKIIGLKHMLPHYKKIADRYKNEYKIEHHDDHILIRPHKKNIEEMMSRIRSSNGK